MKSIKLLLLNIVFISITGSAQPELDIKPNRIEFEDLFSRFDYTFLINKGNQVLTIDSMQFMQEMYLIDFEKNLQLPFTILPDDSVRMNVTLSGYYNVTISDTSDTILVYNNGITNPESLRVKIDFFEDEFGSFNGIVRDSLSAAENAIVYFFYNGVYLLDTALTNSSGFYQSTLPEGEYIIGVEKDGYYVVFHDSTYDPFFAELVALDSGEVRSIDFSLKPIDNSNLSVSGQIIDSTLGISVNKGIVIVRGGTHVPIPKPTENMLVADTIDAFAGFIRDDGTFTIYTQFPDYYYLQAYTNYFLPGFYNDEGLASVYWQNADSVLIDDNILDKNISLVRDSSYGAGSIAGNITFSNFSDESNYEGITILAKNINNGALYSYNFGKEEGNYKVSNIPYGTYELVGQKIGLENAFSQTVTIDPLNNQIQGIIVNFVLSDVENDILVPDDLVLYQNYPNPFNPQTTISFFIPNSEQVKIKISNILGETIAVLLDNHMASGEYEVLFDADYLPSGVYFYTIQTANYIKTNKMLLVK